ncbi:DUF1674 domain-containing protein [Lentilitoribacter sp. Alg239-R112]|jgi:hypothetical protein|uniref:DUF1674 domain-containing protein n=1 Tax=Lentilitoribacter sp. Alg239-R112 TaxID=2305987 RepID=UPI0013A70305|nr:DUF1674 domain-containing protein [Lentilitoribacter sp. Alg239-R112]
MTNNLTSKNGDETKLPTKQLSDAAKRALKEAGERRQAQNINEPAKEYGGRGGKDPSRFGDWEIDGRAIDF